MKENHSIILTATALDNNCDPDLYMKTGKEYMPDELVHD